MTDESPSRSPSAAPPGYRITDNVYAAMILAQAEAAEEAASAWVLAQKVSKGGQEEETEELPETRAANNAAAAGVGLDDDSLELLLGATLPPPAWPTLRITAVETLRCGAGFRDFCFVKISTTARDIVGWSEYLEERSVGVSGCIERLGQRIVGADPLRRTAIVSRLKADTRHVHGGIAWQAAAAIENALLDVCGKALGVSCATLLGGPYRTELPVYWSHCGTFRVQNHEHLHSPHTGAACPPLRSLDGVRALCQEVKASGHSALKTNIFHFSLDPYTGQREGRVYMPGFGCGMYGGRGSPELSLGRDHTLVPRLVEQMRVFRQACGDEIGLRLDLDYNFKTEGFSQIASALTPKALGGRGLDWLELDLNSPQGLRYVRERAPMPIASLESIMGRKALLPYLQAEAVDICIIDPLWNGVDEACRMASLCDTFDVNVSARNGHGWLGTAISAHFCAAIPNFLALEVDVDDVPWKDEIVIGAPPRLENGVFHLPKGPGWGVEIDEAALRRHPPLGDPERRAASGAAREESSAGGRREINKQDEGR